MIGSHNSMSYLKPRRWYLRPFSFMARCQSKSLKEQYEKYGVRLFDIRVSFDKDGTPYFAHGLMQYKGDVYKHLDYLNTKLNVEVRLLLEEGWDDGSSFQETHFKAFCSKVKKKFKNIAFFGGIRKRDWTVIHDFKYKGPEYKDLYSSMQPPKYDDLFPYWYAKNNNKKNIEKFGDIDDYYLLMDFVHIR